MSRRITRGSAPAKKPKSLSASSDGSAPTGAALRSLRTRLLRWYWSSRRPLPWRDTRDPYRIWLSEIMLQQTRVETVLPYYSRFLARFPTVTDLAAAPLDDVLRLWAGLGYYSRARNLHAAAARVIALHQGEFPTDAATLATLPGVGRYTACAVASIAAKQPVAVVDGNVKRVIARLHEITESIDAPSTTARIWTLAQMTLDARAPGDFNQAMMELGATICLPRNPRCDACPVRTHCRAARSGLQNALPVRKPRRASPVIEGVAIAIVDGGRILLEKRKETGLLAGFWGLPQAQLAVDTEPARSAGVIARSIAGACARVGGRLGIVEHVFTHRTLRLHIFAARAARKPRLGNTHAWGRLDGLDDLAKSSLDEKCLALCRGVLVLPPRRRREAELA